MSKANGWVDSERKIHGFNAHFTSENGVLLGFYPVSSFQVFGYNTLKQTVAATTTAGCSVLAAWLTKYLIFVGFGDS